MRRLNRKLLLTTASACALALAACAGETTPGAPTDELLATPLATTALETSEPELAATEPLAAETEIGSEVTGEPGTAEPGATAMLTAEAETTAAVTSEAESTAAATDEPASSATSEIRPRATLEPTAAGAVGTPGGPQETAMPGAEAETVVPSPALLGGELLDLNGERLGTIVDALINAEGQVDQVVIELPEAAGGGTVALPWADLTLDAEQSRVLFSGALNELRGAAEDFELPAELENEIVIRTDGTALSEQFNNLLRLSQAQNLALSEASGEIGSLAGALVNAQSGQVDYVVIDLSPLMGGNSPAQVIVPWEQFSIDPNATVEAQLFSLGVTPELLANAPVVSLENLDEWIDLDAVQWDDQIRSFWEEAG